MVAPWPLCFPSSSATALPKGSRRGANSCEYLSHPRMRTVRLDTYPRSWQTRSRPAQNWSWLGRRPCNSITTKSPCCAFWRHSPTCPMNGALRWFRSSTVTGSPEAYQRSLPRRSAARGPFLCDAHIGSPVQVDDRSLMRRCAAVWTDDGACTGPGWADFRNDRTSGNRVAVQHGAWGIRSSKSGE